MSEYSPDLCVHSWIGPSEEDSRRNSDPTSYETRGEYTVCVVCVCVCCMCV